MPIIGTIGSRSLKVRLVYGAIFAVLITGAVSMVYPLLLMISGSMKSQADFIWVTPFPEYFWNDDILWMKYVESKYGLILEAEIAYRSPIGSWRELKPPQIDTQLVEDFRTFRRQYHWPNQWYNLGHIEFRRLLAKNARRYRKVSTEAFGGDLQQLSQAVGVSYASWSQVGPPTVTFTSQRFDFPETVEYKLFYDLKADSPQADWIPVDPDGAFWRTYLAPEWADIGAYNLAHQTTYSDYREVLLTTHPPQAGLQRTDWSVFVRDFLNLAYVRIDPAQEPVFQHFLAQRYRDKISELNHYWQSGYETFSQIRIPQAPLGTVRVQVDLLSFVKDEHLCPLDALSINGPRQAFEQFVAERRAVPPEQVQNLAMPIEQVDYADFQEIKPQLRREFAKRNYLAVIDYLLLHSNGVINTIIFCSLMIGTQLLINPLAAYALSRYRPPSTYKILLFCMCTMAFPPEVTMIPQFLLLKDFPLFPLLVGIGSAFVFVMVLRKVLSRWPEWLAIVAGIGLGVLTGYRLTPWLFQTVLNRPDANISLLNTFYALVLPRMANGFMIFLLKGFFDSLPRELYEAADLDGASEWTKFWLITMNLSKPILAVMALQAFTMAYSEFMMALVIIPDQRMWTIMIWLFQLQTQSFQPVVYASLLIAAVPTFTVFLLCQNVIMRGIVVPQEK